MSAEEAFAHAMIVGAKRCKEELGYNPTYWLRMVAEHGAVGAAKHLLRGQRASDGFTRLWEEGRLDLSVEFFVLLPEYAELFTDDERTEARRRLELYEFNVDRHLEAQTPVDVVEAASAEAAVPEAAAVEEEAPDQPIVRPVVAPSGANTVWPSTEDLARAHELFAAHEPRDIFYRAATDLVGLALRGQASITVAEALGVLLQTWNRSFYQYQKVGPDHYADIEALLENYREWLSHLRERAIDTANSADEGQIRSVFSDFESVLGPVGAAKALHLLAPRFLPLWDRAIATAYGVGLGERGTNGERYVRFMQIVGDQVERLGGGKVLGRNVLKALDEYNYCRFTKGWL